VILAMAALQAGGSRGLQLCGSIAINDLSAVGAGKPRWLDNQVILVAMAHEHMAIATEQNIVMRLTWGQEEGKEGKSFVRQVRSCLEPEEKLTAMEWVLFDVVALLAVGTSFGALLLFSQKGTLLIKQYFHSDPVLKLRARSEPLGSMSNDSSEDLCVIYPKAIARIDVHDLQALAHRKLREREGLEGGGLLGWKVGGDTLDSEAHVNRLPFLMWNVNGTGGASVIADGALAGIMAPPLLEHQGKRHYCAITVGPDCTLAAFRVSGDKKSSLVGAIMDKVMPATVSRLSSLTKRFWQRDETSESNRPTEVSPQAFSRASVITSLKDNMRKGERLAVSPCGSLAAVADSLGRVLLVDVRAVVVVRLWKGYRDAHCLFLDAPVDGRASYADTNKPHPLSQRWQEFSLCLAIHAPRRGVVEVWQMRHGSRVAVIRDGESCRLLQPSCKLRAPSKHLGNGQEDETFEPARVYFLHGDSGSLSLINPFMPVNKKLT